MIYETWEEFFEANAETRPTYKSPNSDMGIISYYTIEEMYQHFKERMISEIIVDNEDGKNYYGKLKDGI